MYVNERLRRHMESKSPGGVLIFCLESVNRSDPILRKIKTWIDEANAECMPRKQAEVDSYTSKVCGRCGASDNLQTCRRCGLVRYCGRECQVADWKEHKKTCQPCKETKFFSYGDESFTLLPGGNHKGPAKVVQADQDAIMAKWGGDYTRSELAAIFMKSGANGYSSAETRAFVEEAASSGAKVELM